MLLKNKPAVIIGVVAGVAVMAAGIFYVSFNFNARRIFNAQASSLTNRRVEARVVRAQFPARLLVEGLSVEGLLTCERVYADVGIDLFFNRDARVRSLELVRPLVVWERGAPEAPTGVSVVSPPGLVNHKAVRNVILSQLVIRDGAIKFVTLDGAGARHEQILERVELRARNIPLTDTPARTEFSLTASLAKLNYPFVGHFAKMSGWFNWAAKDMDAVAQVIDDDGRIGLDAKFSSRQNDMSVSGTMKLSGDQGPQAVGQKTGRVENALLGILASTQTDIDAGFSFKTKMDRFEIGKVSLTGRVTTSLNSSPTSGNIVADLKAVGIELFQAPESKP